MGPWRSRRWGHGAIGGRARAEQAERASKRSGRLALGSFEVMIGSRGMGRVHGGAMGVEKWGPCGREPWVMAAMAVEGMGP